MLADCAIHDRRGLMPALRKGRHSNLNPSEFQWKFKIIGGSISIKWQYYSSYISLLKDTYLSIFSPKSGALIDFPVNFHPNGAPDDAHPIACLKLRALLKNIVIDG